MTTRRFVFLLAALSVLLTASVAVAGYEEGVAAFKAKNFAQAVAEFQQFVEERPDQQAGYVMLGRSLLSAGQASKAVPHFQKALELKSDDIASQVYLGQAFHQAGKPRDCIAALNKLNIGGLPAGAQISLYQMRGASHARLSNTRAAAADLGRVADLKSSDAKARFEYGQMLQNDAQLDAAIVNFERAISMDGSKAEWKKILVNALKITGRRAQGAAKTRAYSRAEDVARSLVGSNPSYDNLLLLGEVQLGAKNYESAVSTFQQAISKNARDWHAHFYLGQALCSVGRFADAQAPLNTALPLASGDDKQLIWKQLGFAFEKQKKYDLSIANYQKANDQGGVMRVSENKRIAEENQAADQHNRTVAELKARQKELEEQMKEIPGAGNEPPPDR